MVFTSSHFRGSVATPALEGNYVPQVPTVQGGVALTWADPRWFTAATQVRFSGEQFDDDLNTRRSCWAPTACGTCTVSRAVVRGLDAFLRSRTSSTRNTTPRARRCARSAGRAPFRVGARVTCR